MRDSLRAKWPVPELSDDGKYLAAKKVAELFEIPYSTFMKRLKDFVQHGEYPAGAFRVSHRLGSPSREYWLIEVHPVLGIRALNRHFYPRLVVK
jgi:hypothetical protein